MYALLVLGSEVSISARIASIIFASSLSNPSFFASCINCSLTFAKGSFDGAVCFSAGDAVAADDGAASWPLLGCALGLA